MPLLRNMTIKRKLISIIMFTCVLSLLSAGTIIIVWTGMILRQNTIDNLAATADIIAQNSAATLAFNDKADAENILKSVGSEPSIVCACIKSLDGKDLANYYRGGIRNPKWPEEHENPGHHCKAKTHETGLVPAFLRQPAHKYGNDQYIVHTENEFETDQQRQNHQGVRHDKSSPAPSGAANLISFLTITQASRCQRMG